MKGWMVLGLCVAMVGIVAVGPTALASSTPTWKAVFATEVILGQPIQGNVSGPSGGVFTVSLYTQPFNNSAPIVSQRYVLSANSTSANITVLTGTLTLGAYQLVATTTVIAGGGPLNDTIYLGLVHMLDPLNATEVNNQLYQLEQEQAILSGQVAGLGFQVSKLQFTDDLLFWVFFALVLFLLFYDVFKRYFKSHPSVLTGAREAWRYFWTREPIQTYSPDVLKPEITEPTPDPSRKFMCLRCGDWILRTKAELDEHFGTVHFVVPAEGLDYETSKDMEEFVTEKANATKAGAPAQPSYRVDIGDIL